MNRIDGSALFDQMPQRRNSRSIKWDTLPPDCPRDTIPLWVADMDFFSPVEVIQAIKDRADHGVFGYTLCDQEVEQAVAAWLDQSFDWRIQTDWLMVFPGVVCALYLAVTALTRPGDGVIVMPPVYHPFFEAVEKNDRRVIANPLIEEDGVYRIDWQGLQDILHRQPCSLLIFCSPHNPVARVWNREELSRLADLMKGFPGLYVLSDEIHSDLIMPGQTHTPLAKLLDDDAQKRLITARSVSKTFNLAGLKTATLIVSDPDLRARLQDRLYLTGAGLPNPFGLSALVAAYRFGRPWLSQLIDYLWDNYRFMCAFFAERLPLWRATPLQGTYLSWVRIGGLSEAVADFADRLRREAGVWLEAGTTYGPHGEGWVRINLGTPRATLAEALERIRAYPAP